MFWDLFILKEYVKLVENNIELLNWDTEENAAVLQEYMAKEAKNNNEILAIYFANVDGNYVDSSGWIPEAGYNAKDRDWYKDAVDSDGYYISAPYSDAESGGLVITISKNIKINNNLVGVIALDVPIDKLKEFINNLTYEDGSYAFIIDDKEQIIVHPNEDIMPKDGKILKISDFPVDYNGILNSEDGNINNSVDNWIAYNKRLLDFFLENKERCVLITFRCFQGIKKILLSL